MIHSLRFIQRLQTPVITDFLQQSILRINENTIRVEKCLSVLTEEQVWSLPLSLTYLQGENKPVLNSIGNLILHLEGNITQYINSSLGGADDVRFRVAEFAPNQKIGARKLLKRITKCSTKAVDVIASATEIELNKKRLVQGFQLSGTGIIIHVVEHYSYHVGQIALITKLFTNEDLGFYANLDLNITNDI